MNYTALRLILALVVLGAAFTKAHQLATETIVATSLLTETWGVVVLVSCELTLSAWLLSGLFPIAASRMAFVCFVVFGSASLYQWITGRTSCGCFGAVRIHPFVMFALDTCAVAALLIWRPARDDPHDQRLTGQEGTSTRPSLSVARWSIAIPVLLSLYLVFAAYSSESVTTNADDIGNHKVVILKPQRWIGKRFPLFEHIDVGDQLRTGRWTVVLYHHDCPRCQSLVTHYESLPPSLVDGIQVALIEVPPFPAELVKHADKSTLVHGRLAADREWFVALPVEIMIHNGVVVEAPAGS